jgi:hypothetical protein
VAKLWSAAAALEDHAALARHLAKHAVVSNSEQYQRAARQPADAAKALLSRLQRPDTPANM